MHAHRSAARGFTILEWSLAVAILGVLVAIAIPTYERYVERTRVTRAVLDIGAIAARVTRHELDNREFPDSLNDVGAGSMLDPWGEPYQYVNHDAPHSRGRWRRDKNIVPINDDFDLFSMGKDGQSRPPLTAKASRDDIVRANNGRFIGPAAEYDP